MDPATPSLQSVFPDARVDAPLRLHPVIVTSIPARAWSRFGWTMVAVASAIFVSNWAVAHPVGVDRFNDFFDGSGVTYDEDGAAWALAGTWLTPIMIACFGIAAVVAFVLRPALKRPWRRDQRISWVRWSVERGLDPAGIEGRPDDVELPVFQDGRDRDWEGPWRGRVGGGVATVGATAWTTGSGKTQQRHRMFYVHVEMPEAVANAFPGTSLTRFLRGISNVDLDIAGDELRLESIGVDHGCDIHVAGDAEDERWRQLFDPPMLVALHEIHDVQWQHLGRHIAFCAGGMVHDTAPVETLDALCSGAAFVVARMVLMAERHEAGLGAAPCADAAMR